MFQVMPGAGAGAASGPAPRRPERGGVKGFFYNIYYDSFKWSLVKSVLFFGAGVKVANDFVGFDVLAPAPA